MQFITKLNKLLTILMFLSLPTIITPINCRHIESNSNGRVSGGETAERGQFPYQVGIEIYFLSITIFIGNGAIISDRWILSAGHNFATGLTAADYRLTLGAQNYLNDGETFLIKEFIPHPEFNYLENLNDICLLELMTPLMFSDFIQPIALPANTDDIGAGFWARASGWGVPDLSAILPDTNLQYVDLVTLTREDCQARHTYLSYRVREGTICGYSNRIGVGTCVFNGGSPLVLNNQLIGVAAASVNCGDGRPDMFSRVSTYLEWIWSVTGIATSGS